MSVLKKSDKKIPALSGDFTIHLFSSKLVKFALEQEIVCNREYDTKDKIKNSIIFVFNTLFSATFSKFLFEEIETDDRNKDAEKDD